jgi:acyl-CoA reductase LuxC
MAAVRRFLEAARQVHAERARIAGDIVRATGLTAEGVELGFDSLERGATDDELRSLVGAAGRADRIHIILSAGVFVAPLRAIVVARAASDCVTVRPSSRDPILARALVEVARDDAVRVVEERDVRRIRGDEVHVYGRDGTISAVRAAVTPGTIVRGHGAGMGVALVTRRADVDAAAAALAADVVPFDQRGCLSPRVAIVEGDRSRAVSFAQALDGHLRAWGKRVPRGLLSSEERAQLAHWQDALAFGGRLWRGEQHALALGPENVPPVIPPPGRHVYLVPLDALGSLDAIFEHVARYIVAIGTDDPVGLARIARAHARARVSALGRMQYPPLDGPVDLRVRTPSCRE